MARRPSEGSSAREKLKAAGRLAARARAGFPAPWLAPYWRPRILLPAAAFLLALGTGLVWGSWRNLCATCPSVARIRTYEPEQTSKLYSHDGTLIGELGIQRRTPVALAALPKHVPEAIIAVEDKRFYNHGAFDVLGLARAVVGKLTFRNRGGGSTITQQLARNMFEEELPAGERRLLGGGGVRKLRELQVALELERAYTKDQILEGYMNEIYLGRVGYGVQAGSRAFFAKDAWEMDPAEAALIAAVLNLPGPYDPFRHPEAALRRRNMVLGLMADQGYLTEEESEQWRGQPLPTQEQATNNSRGIAPYFEEWVRQILDSRFGAEVYRGGLRVTTTLDVSIQKAAQEAMEYGWDRIEGWPTFEHPKFAEFDTVKSFPAGTTPYLQGALIALDPVTGAVRALIGGRSFQQSKFDRARQAKRQAGSSFKPFVYAAALQSGIPASHVVLDAPVMYPQVSGVEWRPQNFDGTFEGPMTLRYALRRSINMVAIKLGWEEVGIESVVQMARKLGISTEIERVPSITIGAVDVIPMDVAESYSAFATLGTRARPFPILKVENAQGEVLWEPQPERTQVLDSMVARLTVDLLQDAANRGTGASLHAAGFEGGNLPYDVPSAGKTGTTNDATNVWFNGFTPNLVATVWFGFDRPTTITPKATGGLVAAPTWGRFMRRVYYGDTTATAMAAPTDSTTGKKPGAALAMPIQWPMHPGLTTRQVDFKSGKLWSEWCQGEEYTEYFVPGSEPTEVCDDSGRGNFRLPRIGPPRRPGTTGNGVR
jgi:1A family penicillin-binding protein